MERRLEATGPLIASLGASDGPESEADFLQSAILGAQEAGVPVDTAAVVTWVTRRISALVAAKAWADLAALVRNLKQDEFTSGLPGTSATELVYRSIRACSEEVLRLPLAAAAAAKADSADAQDEELVERLTVVVNYVALLEPTEFEDEGLRQTLADLSQMSSMLELLQQPGTCSEDLVEKARLRCLVAL